MKGEFSQGRYWMRACSPCVVVLAVLLVIPATASAAPPRCDGGTFGRTLPAGATVAFPTPACSDADGDPIAIEITAPGPQFGTLDPAGVIPIDERRSYTTHADAEGQTDVIRFRAVAGGETSDEMSATYTIGELNQAPVCQDVAVTVPAGGSVRLPLAGCVDPENEYFEVVVKDDPRHGVFDYGTGVYTPAAGFWGQDLMTFRAIDWWRTESEVRTIAITVTPPSAQPLQPGPGSGGSPPPGPTPPAAGDVTPPILELLAPSSMTIRKARRRGIRVIAATNEAGHIAVRALLPRKAAHRLQIKRNATGAVAIASLKRQITAGETLLRVKLSRNARARLKRASRVKLKLVAHITDAAGNTRTEKIRIKLKGAGPRENGASR